VRIFSDLIHSDTVPEADKGEADASPLCSSGSSDTMDIEFLLIRQIVIENSFNIVNINAARSDVSCNEDLERPLSESIHDLVSLGLAHIPMEAFGAVTGFLQPFAESGGHMLCISEDHDALVLVAVKEIQQMLILLLLIGFNNILRDIWLAFSLGLHNDLDRIVLVFPRNG